jgi:soluble lytic murein transglycosylase-like protein
VGIDPTVFSRQINQESGFNPYIVSWAGAIGIAQIVPRWHPDIDPYDARASLYYAANLMSSHLEHFGGDYAKALAAYNAGRGYVDDLVRWYGDDWRAHLWDETSRYLNIILD